VSVFIDTSAFYAIVDTSDANYGRAAATWQSLLEQGEPLVTTNYTVTETIALLHHRLGTEVVGRFVQDDLPAVTVLPIDEAMHALALAAMLAIPGRSGPSLTDCAAFEVIRRCRIDTVFAYDQHFQSRGFRLIGQ
jgi:predicted nucleic acid-binding protein